MQIVIKTQLKKAILTKTISNYIGTDMLAINVQKVIIQAK